MTNTAAVKMVFGAIATEVFILETFYTEGPQEGEKMDYVADAGEIWTYATRKMAEEAKKVYDETNGEDNEDYTPSRIVEVTHYHYAA